MPACGAGEEAEERTPLSLRVRVVRAEPALRAGLKKTPSLPAAVGDPTKLPPLLRRAKCDEMRGVNRGAEGSGNSAAETEEEGESMLPK